MRATVDQVGRIVVPKAIREAAGLARGQEVEVMLAGPVAEIEPTQPVDRSERAAMVEQELLEAGLLQEWHPAGPGGPHSVGGIDGAVRALTAGFRPSGEPHREGGVEIRRGYASPSPMRLLLDTDIGTDVDDCLAIALLLHSPEVELEAVTCVYGDVKLRARMVQKLLALAGHPEVPVATGAVRPLLGRRPVYWAGHEGLGLLEPDDALAPVTGHAAELIAAKARENPEQLTLLAIGPLTNVALALLIEPELPRLLRGVTIMGGCVRVDDLALPRVEHNFACDPEAAHVVLSAGLPITLVPLDVTLKTRLGAGAPATIRAHRSPLNEAVARQLELYPPFVERGFTTPHDPLAAAAVLKPDLVTTTPLNVSVDYTTQVDPGRLTCRQVTADIAATADVALQVDRPRFETLLLERVAG